MTFRRTSSLAAAVSVLAAMTGACTGEVTVTYPVVPSTLPLRSTTTSTVGIDRTAVPLPSFGIGGTTTTIGFRPSSASLEGIVSGPDGPVAGARVRIERLVGSQTASTIVDADESGHYELKAVELGRVRVRAWHTPDLAMVVDDVFFTESNAKHDLALQAYGRTDVGWAMTPSTPILGQNVNIAVQVSSRVVDEQGMISAKPLSGVGVSVYPQGGLVPIAVGEQLTKADGRAIFTLRCDATGTSSLDVRLATGGQAFISPPPCVSPTVTDQPTDVTLPENLDPAATTLVPIGVVTTVPQLPGSKGPGGTLVPVPVVSQP